MGEKMVVVIFLTDHAKNFVVCDNVDALIYLNADNKTIRFLCLRCTFLPKEIPYITIDLKLDIFSIR